MQFSRSVWTFSPNEAPRDPVETGSPLRFDPEMRDFRCASSSGEGIKYYSNFLWL